MIGALIYGSCTSGAEDRGRLLGRDGWAPRFSDLVSQLPQAAASSTPTGLCGWTAAGSVSAALGSAVGHVSNRYSSIS